jgi:hypothetical protein
MDKPRIVAVMPVNGREELFPLTIKRLYQQEDVDMIVACVGATREEEDLACAAEAFFVYEQEPYTLGGKWQQGVDIARMWYPDAIMIVGSGNWFTNGWAKTLYPYLDDYDIVGSEAMYVYQIRQNDQVMIHWSGYHTKSRKGDMLGAGRLISRRILDKADWQIFDTSLNSALDRSTDRILSQYDARFLTLPQGDEMILKIGSYKWKNINHFTDIWNNPRSKRVEKPEEILKHFPEVKELLA